MNKWFSFKGLLSLVLALVMLLGGSAWAAEKTIKVNAAEYPVTEDGWYSTMEEVAVYLTLYEELPDNFLTKKEAQNRGWDNRKGNLDKVAPGCSIGGDRFGNYEQLLPTKKNRTWTECDINFDGGYRGGERIVFSNDGLIYYTGNHYESFTQVKVVVQAATPAPTREPVDLNTIWVEEGEAYTSMGEVAVYLYLYEDLPWNYMTKDVAKELGWTSKKDNLGKVAPGCAIGGDIFKNKEKLLPEAENRIWYECDVNTVDGKRSEERLVYSNDGLIYYTNDNFKSFEQLF